MLAAFKRAPARDADRIRMQLHLRRAWRWKTPIGLKPSDEIEPNPAFVRGQLYKAEGEGFEPSTSLTTRNGFRDRRIRPLCHLSERPQSLATQLVGARRTVAARLRFSQGRGV